MTARLRDPDDPLNSPIVIDSLADLAEIRAALPEGFEIVPATPDERATYAAVMADLAALPTTDEGTR